MKWGRAPDRRAFLTVAAGAVVSPLAAAVVTTKYLVANSAWTDLGAGPMLLSFRGDGVYAIGDTTPSLADEGLHIRVGDSLPLSTTSHVWVRATSANSVSVYTASIAGGGGGGGTQTSVWSASDAAANGMTLSNGGLTVTPSGAGTWQSVRSSISKTSGKVYVEFANTVDATSAANRFFGLANAAFNPGSYLGNNGFSGGISHFDNEQTSGFTSNYTVGFATPTAGFVYALAIDFTAGSIWIAQNNVWLNGSNPATGTLPVVSFTPATVGALFAGMSFNGAGMGIWTLQPTAASQKYAPPAGFSAWG
jgi:hypothetical protein